MSLHIKRVYEKVEKTDGARILVDRLWPRGVTKAKAHITHWAKNITPSSELRSWFHEDPEGRFKAFQKKYAAELKKNKQQVRDEMRPFMRAATLVTAVKDIEHSHIPTLRSFLENRAHHLKGI